MLVCGVLMYFMMCILVCVRYVNVLCIGIFMLDSGLLMCIMYVICSCTLCLCMLVCSLIMYFVPVCISLLSANALYVHVC